jgi:hypothetical protein
MAFLTDKNMMILLLERGECGEEVSRWLGDNGFIAWKATDVEHVIEELSDFTVRRRPDVVMLEVAGLRERFDNLARTFRKYSGEIQVCGYAPAGRSSGHLTPDIERLKSMISREVRPTDN